MKKINFYKHKDKVLTAIKDCFFYQLFGQFEVLGLLPLFNINYELKGDYLLVCQSFPINAYEIYFRENVPIGCFEYYSNRSKELKHTNISVLIVHNYKEDYLCNVLPEILSMEISMFLEKTKGADLMYKQRL